MRLPATDLPERPRRTEIWRLGLAAAFGVIAWLSVVTMMAPNVPATRAGTIWVLALDPLLGLVALFAAHWRHRWPLAIALFTQIAALGSVLAGGAALLTLASIGTRRRWTEMASVGVVNVLATLAHEYSYPNSETPLSLLELGLPATIGVVAVLAIGYAVGSRREVIRSRAEVLDSLRLRAETAEREQVARAESARAAERNRIAREMHDVLAHRISLVAMHASALAYRPDLPAEEQQAAIRTIDENARQALADLRDVLGVLRQDGEGGLVTTAVEAPQPGLTDLPALLDEARAAGGRVEFTDRTEGGPVPTTTARTAYRIVQEGLTNARKHAPGTLAQVGLAGQPGEGLTVEVRTPRSRALVPDAARLPGAGLGLVGLRERAELVQGRLTHGVETGGDFVLKGWLPWPN